MPGRFLARHFRLTAPFDYLGLPLAELERLVLHCPFPSVLGRTLFEFGRIVHDELPGAGGNLRIGRRQISPGDLQIDGRHFSGLLLGVQGSSGLRPVIGMQTLLFARQFIMNGISAALFAAAESESFFNGCFSQR